MASYFHLMASVSLATLPFLAFAQTVATQEESAEPVVCAKDDKSCVDAIERITVKGRQYTPLSTTAEGSYTLDQDMLRQFTFGNGNLNDVLGLLPGVQYSEGAYSATQVSNIRPAEVSISGAQGYQTAYQIDGVANNSKLSTGNAQVDRNLVQDVSGHSQQSFINTNILNDITVYDSNVPARYGNFSGGLILANTRKAERQSEFGLSVRTTGDQLVRYHRFFAPDFSGTDVLEEAIFAKTDISAYAAIPITQELGVVAQFQQLISKESFDQLGQLRERKQTNTNAMVKINYQFGTQDAFEFRVLYAPYQGDYFDPFARDSDYTIDGGGQSLLARWEADRKWGALDSQLSWNRSENSKTAPNVWFTWRTLPGRDWGAYNDSISSVEGGYGDIDKVQDDYVWRQDWVAPDFKWLGASANLSVGYSLTHNALVFDRKEESIIYNGVVVAPQIDCGVTTFDCVDTSFFRPIEDIESELGRPLNLNNPDDFLLFQQNIKTTGQYFRTRQVSPQSQTDIDLNSLSAYAEQQFIWENVDATIGLRYDYNDFFKNHNIAPRLRAQFSLWDDASLITGINRYYETDVLNYKLNEAIEPFIGQVRTAFQNRLGQWQSAVVPTGPRYQFGDTSTPFSDEFTLGYRHPMFGGVLELKWIERRNRESINRQKGYNDIGEPILFARNNGSSEYRRLSLTWMANFDWHHVEFNVSHASNTTSRENFDGSTTLASNDGSNQTTGRLNFTYDDSELVFIRTDEFDETGELDTNFALVTRHDLSLERQDMNRPVIANISWAMDLDNWQFSAHARYMSEQEAIYPTGQFASISDALTICAGCEPSVGEYPVYRLDDRPAFWLVNANVRHRILIAQKHELTLSTEVLNLFNSRTYQVAPFTTGLELGRQVWFGISYDY